MELVQKLAGTQFTSFTTCFTGTNAQILAPALPHMPAAMKALAVYLLQ